jgi:hypothetical protein
MNRPGPPDRARRLPPGAGGRAHPAGSKGLDPHPAPPAAGAGGRSLGAVQVPTPRLPRLREQELLLQDGPPAARPRPEKQREEGEARKQKRREEAEAAEKAKQQEAWERAALEQARKDAEAKKAAADEEAAGEMLKYARKLIDRGEADLAKERLRKLVAGLPDTKAAAEAKALLETVSP